MAEKGPKNFSRFMRHFPTTVLLGSLFIHPLLVPVPIYGVIISECIPER